MGSDVARVVVTGGAGFIGLNVIERLLTLGHDAVAVDTAALPDAARRAFAELPGAMDERVADVTDPAAIADAVAGAAVVMHGAAITAGADRERRDARRVVDVNVLGTQTVFDAVATAGTVGRIVYVSSGAVYGDRAFGSRVIDEATPAEPVSLYAITKLAGEQLARRHAQLHGTDVVTARLSAVFGPWERDTGVRDSLSPMYRLAHAKRQGARVIAGRFAPRNWLYARDAAAALCHLAFAPHLAHDIYNVTPTEWFEPMQWARHLGIGLADPDSPTDAAVVELPEDARRADARAPVANDRLLEEMDRWPAYGPHDAARDYAAWLETHEFVG